MNSCQAKSSSTHSPIRGTRAVPLCVGYVSDEKVFSLISALPFSLYADEVHVFCSNDSSVSGRRRRAEALASVRRSNCTYTFRVCSFHEDSFYKEPSSLLRGIVGLALFVLVCKLRLYQKSICSS